MSYLIKFTPEVVNGLCPTCDEDTLLVSVTRDKYRCVTCGTDLEQHINGKISYIPMITKPINQKINRIKDWENDG
jgi:uncharacterized protein (DUF983 family)